MKPLTLDERIRLTEQAYAEMAKRRMQEADRIVYADPRPAIAHAAQERAAHDAESLIKGVFWGAAFLGMLGVIIYWLCGGRL